MSSPIFLGKSSPKKLGKTKVPLHIYNNGNASIHQHLISPANINEITENNNQIEIKFNDGHIFYLPLLLKSDMQRLLFVWRIHNPNIKFIPG